MVTVTDVRRDGKRVHLAAGEHRVTIALALYRLRPIEPGEAIDWQEYEQWLVKQQYPYALNAAGRLLSMRAHSTGELKQKLLRGACLPMTAELVLLKLQQMKLVDDAAFAREWAAARAASVGQRRIADELRQKQVPQQLIQQALETLEEETLLAGAARQARSALLHRSRGEALWLTRRKIIARLTRRGYGWDTAKEAFTAALQELEIGGEDTDTEDPCGD